MQQSNNDSTKELAEKDCIILTLEDSIADKSFALEKTYKSIQYLTNKVQTMEKELSQLRTKPEVKQKKVTDLFDNKK